MEGTEIELMRHEDFLGKLECVQEFKDVQRSQEMELQFQLIARAKLVGDELWGEGGKRFGTSILERRIRKSNAEKMDQDEPEHTPPGEEIVLDDALKIKRIHMKKKYWWRDDDILEVSKKNEVLPPSHMILAYTIPTSVKICANLIVTSKKVTPSTSEKSSTSSKIPQSISSLIELSCDIKSVHVERFRIYLRYCSTKSNRQETFKKLGFVLRKFEKTLLNLEVLRQKLPIEKFPLRSTRKAAISRISDMESLALFYYEKLSQVGRTLITDVTKERYFFFLMVLELEDFEVYRCRPEYAKIAETGGASIY